MVLLDAKPHAIENEKFRFRAEIGGIADAHFGKIGFGMFGDRARIARVGLAGARLEYVGKENKRRVVGERIHHRGRDIRLEDHVEFADLLPARDRRAV